MRNELIVLSVLLLPSIAPSSAQVSIGIGLPNVSIGINLPLYPDLEPVPGYPVYYAPGLDYNYFFYDGLYWVYQDDNWYASSWYNGPWRMVGPVDVPLFVLRVPVRYYRHPPMYFQGWYANSPPRWGEHWGNDWSQRRRGWDQWNHKSAPRPAPLPVYQRDYAGDRYPGADRQHELRSKNYSYKPRDTVARQHFQAPRTEGVPVAPNRGSQETLHERDGKPQVPRMSPPQIQQSVPNPPRAHPAQSPGDNQPKVVPQVRQRSPQPQQREVVPHGQPEPNARGQEARPQGREQGAERDSGQGRGREGSGRGNDREDAGGRGQDRGR
jgi:hypothetical protein